MTDGDNSDQYHHHHHRHHHHHLCHKTDTRRHPRKVSGSIQSTVNIFWFYMHLLLFFWEIRTPSLHPHSMRVSLHLVFSRPCTLHPGCLERCVSGLWPWILGCSLPREVSGPSLSGKMHMRIVDCTFSSKKLRRSWCTHGLQGCAREGIGQ